MKNRHLFRVIQIILALIFVLAAIEIGLRFGGYGYHHLPERSFTVVPKGDFFISHNRYGYSMKPGRFIINQDNQLKWISTQNEKGYRLCSETPDSTKPQIWIFGCSFTYGWGNDDSLTYPWLLQKNLPNYTIRNYGVGGYSTYHSLMQLQDCLANTPEKKYPKKIILAYASFHNQRNTASPFWMKSISCNKKMIELQYPYVRLIDSKLVSYRQKIGYSEFLGAKTFATIHTLETGINRQKNKLLNSQAVTLRLIEKIKDLCDENHIEFILFAIDNETDTYHILGVLYKQIPQLNTIMAPIDLYSEEHTFLPYDPHPNKNGHKIYAKALTEWLEKAR